jgi:hypothetical protein
VPLRGSPYLARRLDDELELIDLILHRHGVADDGAIILWRKILAREFNAVAVGRTAKRWTTPPADVVPTLGF